MDAIFQQSEHLALQQAMRRFAWLGKLTLVGTVVLMPVVMQTMPYFHFGHQLAIAVELAGILVMSGALLAGGASQLRQWWRHMVMEPSWR